MSHHTPEPEKLLEQSRVRQVSRMTPRERVVEAVVGGGFVVAAIALLVSTDSSRPIHWGAFAMTVLALAAASRVTFEVGSTYTVPIQLVFVPMLFLAPAEVVPIGVAAAFMVGMLPEVLMGRRP